MTLSQGTFRTGLKHTVTALAVAMSFYHIMTAFFGTPISEVHLPVHLGFALVIIFWTYRKPATGPLGALLILRDVGLTAMAIGGCAYLALNSAELQQRMLYFDPLTTPQLLFGAVLVFTVLEAARRVVGWPLVILGATAIAYALWGNYLPSVLWHRGYSFESVIESTYLTQD